MASRSEMRDGMNKEDTRKAVHDLVNKAEAFDTMAGVLVRANIGYPNSSGGLVETFEAMIREIGILRANLGLPLDRVVAGAQLDMRGKHDFGWAVKQFQMGFPVRRASWSPDLYVCRYIPKLGATGQEPTTRFLYESYMCAGRRERSPWSPADEDIFASDWDSANNVGVLQEEHGSDRA